METLVSARLLLRPWQNSDFAAVHAYASNMENVIFMPFGPNSEQETRDFIELCIEKYSAVPMTAYNYAVTLNETGILIGGCGLYLEESRTGYLGWILHRDHWRKGYGTELARTLLELGFSQLSLHRIYATCLADNYGSYRVMENNGMRREAHFNKNKFHRGEWRDELVYAILEEEWSK